MLLEVCLAGVESAVAAQAGGAGRVELCQNLAAGGTTPSYGTMALVRERLTIPVHVMIRPRGGDFYYADLEFEVMLRDVAAAKALAVDGVVLGVLTADKEIDVARTAVLINAARPLSVTFHRAFDVAADPRAALAALLDLGIDRLLTSGQQATAWEGRGLIRELVGWANGRMHILAGSGINPQNAAQLMAETGIREIHAGSSCAEMMADGTQRVSVERVRGLVTAVTSL
jgi:copper homeostasis protein